MIDKGHAKALEPISYYLRLFVLLLILPAASGCATSARGQSSSEQRPTAESVESAEVRPARFTTGAAFPREEVSEQIGLAVEAARRPDYVVDGNIWELVRQFYRQREHAPAWLEPGGLSSQARSLLTRLCGAEGEGLRSSDYNLAGLSSAVASALGRTPADAKELARAELLLSQAFLAFSSDLLDGRLDPAEVAPDWHLKDRKANLKDRKANLEGLLRKVADTGRLAPVVESLRPSHPEYEELRAALERYRQVGRQGGWPEVPKGKTLRKGDAGERVAELRSRLAATGDLQQAEAGAGSNAYDGKVSEAVKSFQGRHGLAVDGVLGPNTLAALNVPVTRRILQIELNMERLRWLPQELGERFVFVNIPEFRLHAYENNREALTMPVVVGKEYDDRATTVFSDQMEYVVFSPYWNVPTGIAKNEIIPAASNNPGYMAANNYEVVSGWGNGAGVVSPTAANLSRVGGGYRIRQKPGPENSLGLIKFMFPNEFAIYLHDTPAKHLFERRERAYSHGCIRVGDPVELAKFVFDSPEWDGQKIRRMMEDGEREEVKLPKRVPVYIYYLTAFVRDGRAHFRDDLYGADEKLMKALRVSPGERSGGEEACRALLETESGGAAN